MFKMINKAGKLTKTAKDVFQGAYICGPFDETIRVPGMVELTRSGCGLTAKGRRIAAILDSLNIGWEFYDGYAEIYRVKFFREAVADRSEAAVEELAALIPGFDKADL